MQNERFYVKRPTGKVFGPFDRNAIQMMLKTNKLDPDAEVSLDKNTWESIQSVFPDAAGKPNARATMMGGWLPDEDGADLPAPKADLPAPRTGPPDLPAPRSAPDLPAPKKSGPPDLPAPRTGAPDLPRPKPPIDLPLPKSSASGDLPLPKAADLPLPRSSASADLPVPRLGDDLEAAATGVLDRGPAPTSGGDDDLFGGSGGGDDDLFGGSSGARGAAPAGDDLFGGSAGGEDDLFGTPLGGGDDDLFGSSSKKDDDLFGPPKGAAAKPSPAKAAPPDDDDIFGIPVQPPPVADDADLFSGNATPGSDDLFGGSSAPSGVGGGQSDLFGAPSEGDDDLFGSASPASARGDDFLGGDDGFSFLDDRPREAAKEEWEKDPLFGDSHMSAASEASAPAWDEDLLDAPAPQPRAGRVAPADSGDPLRPASTGMRQEAPAQQATVQKAPTVAADRKRGGAVQALIGVAAVAIIGGGGYFAYTAMTSEPETVVAKPTEKVTAGVSTQMLKSDNFADYAPLGDAAAKPKAGEEGLWLLANSMMLARFDDPEAVKRATPVAQKLDGAKSGFDALGRGAWEARSGNADAARAYLEGLATESGEIGFFANLLMGIGDVKAIETELVRMAGAPMEAVPAEAPAPPTEAPAATNGATNGGTNAAQTATNGGGTNGAPAEPAAEIVREPVVAQGKVNLNGLDDRARTALQAAIKADPSSALPHYWLGRLESQLGRPTEAIAALDAGLNLAPKHVGTNLELGVAHYATGGLNKAIEYVEKVAGELANLAGPAEKARALHFAGLVHVARRDSDLAVESFTKALNIDANRGDTLRALAEEYERAQKYKEALTFFTTNKKLAKNDPNVMLGIVRSHIGLEQWQHAIATLEEGQKAFPQDAQFPYYLGQLYMKRGAFADAQKPLERAVEIDPSLLNAHATLAQLAWRTDKDVERSEAHVREIVARPRGIDANVATAVAEYYALSGNRPTAEQWYNEALRRDKNHWPARLALSRLLLEEGRQEQAKELLEEARKEGVQDVRLSAYLADAYRQAQDYDRAIEEINQVIEAFPKSEDYIFIRGRIHFDRGNYETARDDFQRAYDLNPRYHDAYFYVGRTAFEQKDFATALKIFRHVLDYKPENGNYRFYMGRTLEAEGRATQALEEYRKATAVDPAFGIENPMVYVYRGRLLARLNYTKEGKADIARALEVAPQSVEALIAMAEAEYADRDYGAAATHYKAALDLDPMQPAAQAALGMSYLYTDRRTEAAQRLQLAVKYGHDDPEVFKRLGYLYKELGQRGQARDAFKMFLEKAQEKGDVPAATKREVLDQIESL